MSEEAAPGIHRLRLPLGVASIQRVNSYLVEGRTGAVLVDSGQGTPEALDALRIELETLGMALENIHTVVVTHAHSDHYGLAGTLKEMGHLRLLMHRLDWQYLQARSADSEVAAKAVFDWLEGNGMSLRGWSERERRALIFSRRYALVAPDRELEDGDVVETGRGSLRVVWTPGHSPGHICLYDAEQRLLLSGDHVLDPITPHVGTWPGLVGDSLGSYLDSLRKMAALDVNLVLPGHGKPFTGLRRRTRELLDHHRRREGQVVEALSYGPATGFRVASLLQWTQRRLSLDRLSLIHRRLALGVTLAYLEKLRREGGVSATTRQGLVWYRTVRGSPQR